jgi:SsrA-binding protein
MSKKPREPVTIIHNKKARFEYEIEETFEAGIVLVGSEVKSLRQKKVNIIESFADIKGEEVFLRQLHIAEYPGANQFNHVPTRPRKLLLKKREIRKLIGKIKEKGYTLVPITLYFNEKNIVKLSLGVGKGKKLHDKRETAKSRDWERQKARVLKGGAHD